MSDRDRGRQVIGLLVGTAVGLLVATGVSYGLEQAIRALGCPLYPGGDCIAAGLAPDLAGAVTVALAAPAGAAVGWLLASAAPGERSRERDLLGSGLALLALVVTFGALYVGVAAVG